MVVENLRCLQKLVFFENCRSDAAIRLSDFRLENVAVDGSFIGY